MHEVQAKSILSAQNGMNIYRGCTHGCIYCDSRSTCYQMQHEFDDVEVKVNAPILLEQALRSKRKRCMIATGSMSDPYLQEEQKRGLTRQCLELIDEYGFGLSIQTKSNLILRDLDLLKSINRKTKCVVNITITTIDEALSKIIEPNVCTTSSRFEILNILRDEGIPTICWMTPILPFINDTAESIEGILSSCLHAQCYGIMIMGIGMTLRDGDRQYFYRKLDEHFPGMKERYIREYGNAYELSSPNSRVLMAKVHDVCTRNQLVHSPDKLFQYMHEFIDKEAGEQLRLFT